MIVVSNTSPLTSLAAIGQFDLLSQLYKQVHIAEGVWAELNYGGRQWPGSAEVAAAGWIQRHVVRDQVLVAALRRDLDRGEAESVVLALELRADLVLLDEKEGRHAAQALSLRTLGVVGLLLAGKAGGILREVRPCLDALRAGAGFYLDEGLYRAVLAQANEG